MTCMVHYNSDKLTKFSIGTFLSNTNLPILVVDNSPNKNFNGLIESDRITSITNESKNEGRNRSHGSGVDLAIDWCRKNEFTHMVHIEHDCFVGSMKWFDSLYKKAEEGFSHAYSNRLPHGAHPTPSIWQISEIRHGFDRVLKGEDKNEAFYKTLSINVKEGGYQDTYWDTGMKNWYELEKIGKSTKVEFPSDKDFKHLWAHSYRPSQGWKPWNNKSLT